MAWARPRTRSSASRASCCPTLGLGQIGLAGVKPLETLTGTLGIKGGPGFIELAPGQNVTLFCDGALGVLGALCTEISVGTPKETKLPDGSIKEESAAVSIHLFKGLNGLVPGLNLGSILGNAALDTVLAPLSGATGLSLGEKTDVPGIRLALAQTVAQAGGTKVMAQVEERQRAAAAEVPAATPAPAAGSAPHRWSALRDGRDPRSPRCEPRGRDLPPASPLVHCRSHISTSNTTL